MYTKQGHFLGLWMQKTRNNNLYLALGLLCCASFGLFG